MTEHGEQTASVAHKHAFANKLYKAVAEELRDGGESKNMVISPISLEMVLCAAACGAKGVTQEQITTAIGMPMHLEPLKQRFALIRSGLQSNAITIRVATKIFVQEQYSLRQNFLNACRDMLGCEVAEVDFCKEPAHALTTINGWVNEKTEELIQELITSDDISSDTRLVLANAIYFKGRWAHPFDPQSTRKDTFNLLDGSQVDVDMMSIEKRFRYGSVEELKAEVLEIPYEGRALSMVILLPFADSSILDLESKVSSPDFDLSELLDNNSQSQQVTVYLPKFKLELTTHLDPVLAKLGMTHMFTDNADFSGMTDSIPDLKVGKVVQKAFIEVSEEGTEATAATGLIFMPKGVRRVKNFFINRPFIMVLQEQVSGIILFSGQVVDPSKSKELES